MAHRLLAVVIEGNAEMSGDCSAALRRAGYYVVEASTLGAAQAAVRGVCPDLVVLGGALPDGDGLMMLETWRQSRTAMNSVPVIVLLDDGRRKEIDAVVRECLATTAGPGAKCDAVCPCGPPRHSAAGCTAPHGS